MEVIYPSMQLIKIQKIQTYLSMYVDDTRKKIQTVK